MRAACIDIGSNTTRLLVADCDARSVREVHQERAFTQIGKDVAGAGRISTLKMAEVGEVVAAQLERARAQHAEPILCVATAAVRRAGNSDDLIRWIERRCVGLTVLILSEQEEARLAFLGAARTLTESPPGPLGLVDVGGGSSELVVGDADGTVRWWTSVATGSADLTARFVQGDPPAPAEINGMRRWVQQALSGVTPPRAAMVVAVGGSAASLVHLSGQVLDRASLDRALELVGGRSADDVASQTGLDAQRVRLLPAGLLILREAAARFGQSLIVGAGGLREGMLLDAAGA